MGDRAISSSNIVTKKALILFYACYEKVYLWWYELQQILSVYDPDQVHAILGNPPPRIVSEVGLWNYYCTQSRSSTEAHASSTCYYEKGSFVS
jgi:hypothetical protein